ncbi:SUN domain-containing protein [Mycena sanguinolenta]|uniref:SUN domain-containing protein n=1 Tax=Mycena sanguinolenta TaxID=230812 RepID=A0A8H6ZCM9_9AGAR|nr:SUN domain-containing protein [Mycena sanguinolenta]
MNRLTALEANYTPYARYVEEHTSAVGRKHRRTLLEWETQRKRVDAEYRKLMRRVEYRFDEIVLGEAPRDRTAAAARRAGSRGEAVMVPSVSRSALRAWGRRNLSLRNLSGSGMARLRSRSRSPKPVAPKPKEPRSTPIDARADPPIKFEFPTTSAEEKPRVPPSSVSKPKPPRLNLHGPARPPSRTRSIGNTIVVEGQRAHSRTPTLGRTSHRRPAERAPRFSVTTTTTRDSIAAAPRSAPGPAADMSAPDLGVDTDVFASPSLMPSGARSAGLRMMGLGEGSSGGLLFQDPSASPTFDLARGALDRDADAWVDTDGSEVDGDADGGLESPWMERADQVAVGA